MNLSILCIIIYLNKKFRSLQHNFAESFGEGSIGPFPAIDFIESAASIEPARGLNRIDLDAPIAVWDCPFGLPSSFSA
jgi:hypothetical protein